ncbi:hypothetical protein F0562_013395 [Nyssa sinensis]|uniref:Uncharacterized protein n=1 Tax=Nyssa sinensis TaxID=561372 RepID=A0A5J4ZQ07_9ASTE|nr:hypothetical protein F0562_013395 [Nyssa sinensis]
MFLRWLSHLDPLSVSSVSQLGISVSQPLPNSASPSTIIAQANSRIRNFIDNMQSEIWAPTGQSESSGAQNLSGSGAGNERSNRLRNLAVNGTREMSSPLLGYEPEPERDGLGSGQGGSLDLSRMVQ